MNKNKFETVEIGGGYDDPQQISLAIATKVNYSMQHKASCCLCGNRTRNRGVFFPYNPQLFGSSQGKTRYFIYPICEEHLINIETSDLIEDILQKEFGEI